jgi:hypothetical protein
MLTDGSSTLFVFPSVGTIKDLPGFGSVTDFEEVQGSALVGGATVHFDLASVVVNGAAAVGNCNSNADFNSCTPANSPFTLLEDGTGTQLSISFNTLLNGYTGTSAGGTTPYSGMFSMQVAGVFNGTGACGGITANTTNFISCEAAGGTILTTWSATETPVAPIATPEPTSIALMGSVLLALTPFLRRRRLRNLGSRLVGYWPANLSSFRCRGNVIQLISDSEQAPIKAFALSSLEPSYLPVFHPIDSAHQTAKLTAKLEFG